MVPRAIQIIGGYKFPSPLKWASEILSVLSEINVKQTIYRVKKLQLAINDVLWHLWMFHSHLVFWYRHCVINGESWKLFLDVLPCWDKYTLYDLMVIFDACKLVLIWPPFHRLAAELLRNQYSQISMVMMNFLEVQGN